MSIKTVLTQIFQKQKDSYKTLSGDHHGFHKYLNQDIRKYTGRYADIISYCPSFFKLLCNIINDRFTDWNTKLLINAALAYFVLPEDVIPDREEAGYVDDLYIVCYVLKEIKDNVSPQLITENWEGKEDILSLVDTIYEKTTTILGKHQFDVLRKVGLQKYQSLELAEYSGTYPQRLAKLGNEKRELLGLLAYLVKHIHKVNIRGLKVEEIQELLKQYGDYDEIERLIELSKQGHIYQPSEKELPKKKKLNTIHAQIDSELKAARMKALLDEEFSE